jgi:hypothetical protein
MLDITGSVVELTTFTGQSSPAKDANFPTNASALSPVVTLFLLDIPTLRDDHLNQPGYYVAMANANVDAAWNQALLYKSDDDVDANFKQISGTQVEFVMGYLSATTNAGETFGEGNFHSIDYSATYDVKLFHGSLSSVTESDIELHGRNRAIIGNEIIHFVTATLIGTNEYRLSGIARGVYDQRLSDHAEGERFCLLDPAVELFIPINASDRDKVLNHRAIQASGDITAAVTDKTTYGLINMKPFAPSNLDALRLDANDDIVLSWQRRTRTQTALFQDGDVGLVSNELDQYTLQIFDPTGATLEREVIVTGNSYTWTTAMQTADGYTTPIADTVPIRFKVRQWSTLYGPGDQYDTNSIDLRLEDV